MNPVFPFMIIILAIIFWFLCAFLYTPLGRVCKKIWNDAMKAMGIKDEENDN